MTLILKPLKIGKIEIKYPVILAPMAGITDEPFRKLVKSFGAGMVTSEMVASKSITNKNRKTRDKMDKKITEEHPISVQIFGGDAKVMAEAAKICEENGADIIDINMGCPVKKVVKTGGGADLLRNLPKAKEIITNVVKAVKIPVSIKTRIGWDATNLNGITLAKIAEDEGAKLITIHGRTRNQLYAGLANWDEIARIKQSLKIPVIGNGDIISEESAEEKLKKYNIDGLMIGRGICGKPWLISHIIHFFNEGKKLPDPTINDKKEIAKKHFNMMLDFYEEREAIMLARKHLAWYSNGIKNSAKFRLNINKCQNSVQIIQLLDEFFV